MSRHPVVALLCFIALAAVLSVHVPACAEQKREDDPYKALLGKPAPDFRSEFCLNGKPTKLSDLKGKVVLLDFWAVWCGPCIATFPNLRDWHKEYKDKGLEVIGVTTYFKQYGFDKTVGRLEPLQQNLTKEQEQQMLKDFAAHHKLEYRLAVLPEKEWDKVADEYKVDSIPQAVLIDRKGIVRMIKVGAEKENEEEIAKRIKELIAEREK